MDDQNRQPETPRQTGDPSPRVKLVAAIPELDKTPEELEEMKQHDGYDGSCSVIRK